MQRNFTLLHLGKLEQILHQMLDAVRFLADDVQIQLFFFLCLIQFVFHYLGVSLQIGDWRPQLMGDIRQKLLPGISVALQINRQIVNGCSQKPDFIIATDRQPCFQLPCRKLAGCLLHLHQRARQHSGYNPGNAQGQHKSPYS
ncbi:hypothetical protein D3C73_965240 [compost metagenome]